MAKVVVVVPQREGFNGFWSAGKFWPNGQTEADVSAEELAQLKSETLLGVTDLADILKRQQQRDEAAAKAQALEAAKKVPPSLLPTREEFEAAGYDPSTYDRFVTNRKAELTAIMDEAAAKAISGLPPPPPPAGAPPPPPAQTSAPTPPDAGASSPPDGKTKGKGK